MELYSAKCRLEYYAINSMEHFVLSPSLAEQYTDFCYHPDNIFHISYLYSIQSLYPRTRKLLGGVGEYIGFIPSVRLSIRPSVCPSRIPCPLCSAYSTGWIHFIFIHLIKQLECVWRVQCLAKFQNLHLWHFVLFVTLTLSCFDLGSDVNHSYG